MTPNSPLKSNEMAKKTVTDCDPQHIILGLKSFEMGIQDNPISGGGCACEKCIAKAISIARREGMEEALAIAEKRESICQGYGDWDGERECAIVAQEIRTQIQAEEDGRGTK